MYAERKKVLNGQTTDNDVVIIKELVKVGKKMVYRWYFEFFFFFTV